jgi:hypothetical protein
VSWRMLIPGRAFAPVIVFIPRSGDGCKPGDYDAEWLPRQCPACLGTAVIGHLRMPTGGGDESEPSYWGDGRNDGHG